MRSICVLWTRTIVFALGVGTLAACDDPAPVPVCESIQLTLDSATMYFREPLSVSALPRGHLGVVVARPVNWSSRTAGIISVVPTTPDGTDAELRPIGVGTTTVDATCDNVSRSLTVSVLDTAYAVSVTPSSAQLTVGDTITLSAVVSGPASVSPRVRWRVPAGSSVLLLTSADSASVRLQVTGTSASIVARARADSTKSATPTLTTSAATLAFVTQPSSVAKGSPFVPAVQVAVRNAAGATSTRAVSQVHLSVVNDGTCAPGTQLGAARDRFAVAGVATFTNLTLDRTGAACRLSATADPPATAATSSAFAVSARGCTPIPYTLGDTIAGLIESADCAVTRAGATYYTHRYTFNLPALATQLVNVTYSSAYAPRIEAAVWPPAGAVWADSAAANATAQQSFALAEGTHTLSLTSVAPQAAGDYVLTTVVLAGGGALGCRILATIGMSHSSNNTFPDRCPVAFQARPGGSKGRSYVVYLPGGQSITGTLLAVGSSLDMDTYLEVFDITGTRTLIGSDDNGAGGTNARFTVSAAASDRWIEFLASFVNIGGTTTGHSMTIR